MSKRINILKSHLTSDSLISSNDVVNGVSDPNFVVKDFYDNITQQQRKQYNKEGYFIVKGLLKPEEVTKFTNRFLEIIKNGVEVEGMTKMKDVSLVKEMKKQKRTDIKGFEEVYKIQDWQNDDQLMEYCRNERILKYVKPLIGDNLRSVHTMVINKPPDLGTGTSKHPVHQDLLYFPFRPSNGVVASWTALEKVTRENGCLYVLPGSHKGGLFKHLKDVGGNAGYVGVEESIAKGQYDQFGVKECYMEAGDTIFFHPCLLHGSGPNHSGGFRMAISCHYASGLATFANTLPEHNWPLIDEVLEAPVRSRLGAKAASVISQMTKREKLKLYSVFWKNKSRQLCGIEQTEWQINEQDMALLQPLFSPSTPSSESGPQ